MIELVAQKNRPKSLLIRRIKARREELGWHQIDLAEKSGIGISTIKAIESGATLNPTIETISSIAGALNVSNEYLLGKEEVYSASDFKKISQRLDDLEKSYGDKSSRARNIEIMSRLAELEALYRSLSASLYVVSPMISLDAFSSKLRALSPNLKKIVFAIVMKDPELASDVPDEYAGSVRQLLKARL